MNMFEVTTLGQPLEVLKTQMAANRSQTMGQAFNNVWARGGIKGFYQGLIPWVSLEMLGYRKYVGRTDSHGTGLDRGVNKGSRAHLHLC